MISFLRVSNLLAPVKLHFTAWPKKENNLLAVRISAETELWLTFRFLRTRFMVCNITSRANIKRRIVFLGDPKFLKCFKHQISSVSFRIQTFEPRFLHLKVSPCSELTAWHQFPVPRADRQSYSNNQASPENNVYCKLSAEPICNPFSAILGEHTTHLYQSCLLILLQPWLGRAGQAMSPPGLHSPGDWAATAFPPPETRPRPAGLTNHLQLLHTLQIL